MMKTRLFIVLIVLFFIEQGQAQVKDIKLPEGDKNKYSVTTSNENTVLLDNQSGETWVLVKKPGSDQSYEWSRIKSVVEPNVNVDDWSSIVQQQNQAVIKADRSALVMQYRNELQITQQKLDQLEAKVKEIEQAVQEQNEQLTQQTVDEFKERTESAKELWKQALKILKEIQQRQEETAEKISRI